MIWHSNCKYSDAGTKTCAGYPGSLGYEATDAATWESWDIDCELYDYCHPRYVLSRLSLSLPDLKYGISSSRLIIRHIPTVSQIIVTSPQAGMILAWVSNLFWFPRTRMTCSSCHRLPQGAIGSKLGLSACLSSRSEAFVAIRTLLFDFATWGMPSTTMS